MSDISWPALPLMMPEHHQLAGVRRTVVLPGSAGEDELLAVGSRVGMIVDHAWLGSFQRPLVVAVGVDQGGQT